MGNTFHLRATQEIQETILTLDMHIKVKGNSSK